MGREKKKVKYGQGGEVVSRSVSPLLLSSILPVHHPLISQFMYIFHVIVNVESFYLLGTLAHSNTLQLYAHG